MKKFFWFFAVIFALLNTVLQAANPAEFIPGGVPVVIRIDYTQLKKLSWLAESFKTAVPQSSDFFLLIAEFEQFSGIKFDDIAHGTGYIAFDPDNDEDFIFLFNIKIPEAEFAQKLKKLPAQINHAEAVLAGSSSRIYMLSMGRRDKKAVLAYLTEDVAMVTLMNSGMVERIASAKKRSGNELVRKLDNSAAVSMILKDGRETPVSSCDASFNITDSVDIRATLLTLKANVLFRKSKKAKQAVTTYRLVVPAVAGVIFGKDPKLLGDLVSGWKAGDSGNAANFQFSISRQNLIKALQYLSDPANRAAMIEAVHALEAYCH